MYNKNWSIAKEKNLIQKFQQTKSSTINKKDDHLEEKHRNEFKQLLILGNLMTDELEDNIFCEHCASCLLQPSRTQRNAPKNTDHLFPFTFLNNRG